MTKIAYESKKFRPETMSVIRQANGIISEYLSQGMALTLRQLYYRFIATDALPDSWVDPVLKTKNTQKNYKRLGSICAKARLAGEMDWFGIEDRTRSLSSRPHWDSPAAIVASCASQFSVDRWKGQSHYVEVWFEKDALAGVFSDPCRGLDVPFFSCRGYGSLSELWSAGRRLRRNAQAGMSPVILHFGDHDPSGIDMTRDVRERLSLFAERDVLVERIALNMDQVDEYDPPPNFAKVSDSRYSAYAREYGNDCWELDALEPTVLRDLVEENVGLFLDLEAYEERIEVEKAGRETLSKISERWDDVEQLFGKEG